MIIADTKSFEAVMGGALDRLVNLFGTKEKAAQMAIAKSLGAGATVVARAAKSAAPKGKRTSKGGKKTYGKTGLLKKAIKAKSGVSKKGKAFAVVGPSKDVKEDVKRGRGNEQARPSQYAHLVEFGFNAHHRVPLITGRRHEAYVKKGVLWKPSDLARYVRKRGVAHSNFLAGKMLRYRKFMGGAGQGSTRVAARPFMAKAYASTKAAAGEAIMARYAKELEKILAKLAKAAKKK